MKYWAIGKKNKPVRIVIQAPDETVPLMNRQTGEVFVEVPDNNVIGKKIARDGKSLVDAGPDMMLEKHKIQEHRFSLLARTDYLIMPDYPLPPDVKTAWSDYRQALRDITTDQPNAMFDDVVWPVPPSPLS